MNTIPTTASTNASILAIDLGKYKSVACVHDQETGEFRFTTFETTRDELQRLIGRDHPTVVIIEACLLAGWFHDLCVELGSRVANGIVRRLTVTKGTREEFGLLMEVRRGRNVWEPTRQLAALSIPALVRSVQRGVTDWKNVRNVG